MAKEMSKEQAAAFERVIKGAIDALAIFQKTGRRDQFVAVNDQLDAYRKEFDAKVEIKLGDKKIF